MLSWCRIFSVFLRHNCFVGGFYVVICKLYTCWWLPISRICWIGYKLFFSWAGGYSCFKQSSVKFLAKSSVLKYFLNLINLFGGVINRFSNRLRCHMPCESLNEFRKTETQLRVRGGCHVSTLSGSGRDSITQINHSTTCKHLIAFSKMRTYECLLLEKDSKLINSSNHWSFISQYKIKIKYGTPLDNQSAIKRSLNWRENSNTN